MTIAFTISLSTPLFLLTIIPIIVIYAFIQVIQEFSIKEIDNYGNNETIICVQRFYIASTRQLKRLESTSKSPIFSHLSETLAGVSTIRAYKAEHRFIKMMQFYLDENLVYLYPNLHAIRWLGLRLEMVKNENEIWSLYKLYL